MFPWSSAQPQNRQIRKHEAGKRGKDLPKHFLHLLVLPERLDYGNRIACILVPGGKCEMIEIWEKQTFWGGDEEVIVQDREGMRKTGYSPISGAYYSARLAVCEHLKSIRRCARVILVRSTSGEYWAPLGTWVVREAARKAMAAPPLRCESLEEAVRHAVAITGSDRWVPHSTLIPELKTQRTLGQFR